MASANPAASSSDCWQVLFAHCSEVLLAADAYALPLASSLQNNRSDLGDTPLYDYKMVDSDWLLLPAAVEYFLRSPQVSSCDKTCLLCSSICLSTEVVDL